MPNLVPGEAGTFVQLYVYDRQTQQLERVSENSDGTPSAGDVYVGSISGDGYSIGFSTWASNLVRGDLNTTGDVFLHHRQTDETRRVSINTAGEELTNIWSEGPAISANGRYVAFEASAAGGSGALATGVYVIDLEQLPTPAPIHLITNGVFMSLSHWNTWDAITHRLTSQLPVTVPGVNSTFEFYRNARGLSAAVLQITGVPLPADAALTLTFKLGNTSPVRKRVVAILHDNDWSDQMVCSFWIPPNTPLRAYTMTAATGEAWTNTTLSFYGSPAENIGWIQLDDVSLIHDPTLTLDMTRCVDPDAPG
jgi:hypothetical protein